MGRYNLNRLPLDQRGWDIIPVARESAVLFEEGRDQSGHLVGVRLQRKMPCIQQVNLRIGQIPLIGSRTCGQEGGVMTSPYGQQRGAVFAEIRLEGRIERDI